MVILIKLIAEWCCKAGFPTIGLPEQSDPKESTGISEPNIVPSENKLEELRTEIKTMMMSQQQGSKKSCAVEDVVVEIDYLPVYQEKEGRLKYGGSKAKITFSEVRVVPSEEEARNKRQ